MGATAQATPRKGDGGGGGGLRGGDLWAGASWDRIDRARRWVAASILANCLQRDKHYWVAVKCSPPVCHLRTSFSLLLLSIFLLCATWAHFLKSDNSVFLTPFIGGL